MLAEPMKMDNKCHKRNRLYSTNFGVPQSLLRVGTRTVFTSGRPPWYTCDGQPRDRCFVIGICGGSGSGKTTVARKIIEHLNISWVSVLAMDSYYKVLTPKELEAAFDGRYDFDHPNAFDIDLLSKHLSRIREGKRIEVPIYDFKTNSRVPKTRTLYGANVVIFEGVLAFYYPELTRLMDLKVFVDTDSDERLSRRLVRDTSFRGRSVSDVLKQYNSTVKPAYDQYIAPTMSIADIIIPRGGDNFVGIDIIVQHVEKRLKERTYKLRSVQANGLSLNGLKASAKLNGCGDTPASINGGGGHDTTCLPPNLHVMPHTPQTHCLHTLIRDRDTIQEDFVFFSERLMRPLCEFACRLLPYEKVVIDTPQGIPYHGRRLLQNTKICGVSILRAGEAFELSLCAVCKNVCLGKLLIQTNPETLEPELHYLRLPNDIKDCYVFLMDTTVASGAAAIMAIRVLLEHDVPEDHIILISLIMAVQGVHSVAYVYPSINIVTSAVDPALTEDYHIIPGIGNFGDRYFGTSPLK